MSQMKRKIAASTASLGAAPEVEDLVDDGTDATRIEPSQQTPVIRSKASGEQHQGPSRMSTPSIRSAQSKRLFEAEEAILAGIQERTGAMITMREEYLERQRGKDRERETFVEWMRSVIYGLDHGLWRRCQRELTSVMYRYQTANDDCKNELTSAATSSSQSASYQWQPPPHQWPTQPIRNISPWQSQDAYWIAHQYSQYLAQPQSQTAPQFPHPAAYTLTQLRPVRQATAPAASTGQRCEGMSQRCEGISQRCEVMSQRCEGMFQRCEGMFQRCEGMSQEM